MVAFHLFICFFNKFSLLPLVLSQDALQSPILHPSTISSQEHLYSSILNN